MARFTFELDAVLEHRAMLEREKQLVVAGLETQRLEAEERIRSYQAAIAAGKDDLRERLAGAKDGAAVDLRPVRAQAAAALHLVGRARQAVLHLAGVHQRLSAARLELLEATTRRKAVEVLKHRRYERWRAEERRREDAALDELNVMSASRVEDRA